MQILFLKFELTKKKKKKIIMSVLLDFLIKIKFLALPNIIIIRAVSEICNTWEM